METLTKGCQLQLLQAQQPERSQRRTGREGWSLNDQWVLPATFCRLQSPRPKAIGRDSLCKQTNKQTNKQTIGAHSMPPAKSIFVDRERILRTIAADAAAQEEAARSRAASLMWGEETLRRFLPEAAWVRRDLEHLAGKSLTASERIRHQQAVRAMEAEGLIELVGMRVKLTDAGRAELPK